MFLSIGRITSIGAGQIITTGLINLRRFQQRGGEVRIIAELARPQGAPARRLGRGADRGCRDRGRTVSASGTSARCSCARRKTSPSPFAKGATVFAAVGRHRRGRHRGEAQSADAAAVASYADLRPADLANALLDLPEQRMLEVAEELSTSASRTCSRRCPRTSRCTSSSPSATTRAADVLDQMQPDDAADLPRASSRGRGEALLELMEPEEADDVRFLLSYAPDTAGGLMTTEPIIVSADATVAEGSRSSAGTSSHPALGAAVCVTLPPYEPPTGRFLGMVHFQRMLRYPPQRAARHPARPDPRAGARRHARRRGVAHPRLLQPGLGARRATSTTASSGW